jgi:Peptidase C13 family
MSEYQSSLVRMLRLWMLVATKAAPSLRFSASLALVWLLSWGATDWFYAGPNPQFFSENVPLLAWYALAILGLTGLLRWRMRPALTADGALALAVGLVPLPLLLQAASPFLTPRWLLGLNLLGGLYCLLFLARGLRALTGYPHRLRAVSGILFLLIFIWLTDVLNVIPNLWVVPERDAPIASTDASLADQEGILFEQSGRIDRALAAIGRDSTSTSRAFFLGFAGVGEQKVFAQEIGLASQVLGERFHIGSRSLSLINDERDLERLPLASVSALKYALRGLAARMNLDRDVLFLSISSHGSDEPAIAVSNSQLPLDDLSGEALADALKNSGIKWQVIIISACYAGGFIEPLKSPNSIIITAAAVDRTSFGCGTDSDLTYFGEAFYRDAIPHSHSLREAFDKAKADIAARERRERIEPSKPAAFFGAELESKLTSINSPAP